MTRREWLTRVFGAAVAAAVAPLVDLTDMTPAFWNQPPLQELLPWKVVFPNGNTYTFNARVIAERLTDDGSVELTVEPKGPVESSRTRRQRSRPQPPVMQAECTNLTINDGMIMELQEVTLPEVTRSSLDDMKIGTPVRGSIKFTVKHGA